MSDLVYNSSSQEVEWRCLSGCLPTPPSGKQHVGLTDQPANMTTDAWPASAIWSSDPSYGDALAFDGALLAVAAPKRPSEGNGYVDIWVAAGPGSLVPAPVVAGNTRFTHWARGSVVRHEGAVGFGSTVVLKGGILVVGAPAAVGSRNNASVHVYLVAENGEAAKLCDYWRPPGDFGISLAIQPGRGGRYTAVVGEPSAGRVYAILVSPNEQSTRCRMQSIIRSFRDVDMGNTGDGFGKSLALTHEFLFIGAPDVLREDPQQAVISGLLHILAFCNEGSYLQADIYSGCVPCPNGEWSSGSQVQQCSSCIPRNAVALQGCDFTCNVGYFGDDCLPCSQAMSDSDKPSDSEWVDGEASCSYTCNPSFERVGAACVKCSDTDAADHNGVWIPETCGWTCADTFFARADTLQPDCVPCSVFKQRQGEEPPSNAMWVDGLSTCEYGPKLGYTCALPRRTNFEECRACPALVANAHWTNLEPTLDARCDYACDAGFFGHPDYEGVCETCADFLENVLPEALRPIKPARSVWDTGDGSSCDASVWVCVAGTHRSSTDSFCCPDIIENAVADASVRPCQVRCIEGFWWNADTASCDACFALPAMAEWTEGNCTFLPIPGFKCVDHVCEACAGSLPLHASYVSSAVACTYECEVGFFGHPTYIGRCEPCPIFMEQVVAAADRVTLPAHAAWEDSDTQTECTRDSWTCGDGYVRSETHLYCCPVAPDPNAVPWEDGTPCKLSCNNGYMWSDREEKCINCPEKPPHSEWTVGCDYACNSGYFGGSDDGQCLNCRAYRHLKGQEAPPNAVWPEDSSTCSDNDFECAAGYYTDPCYEQGCTTNPVAGCCPTVCPEGGAFNGPISQCYINCQEGWSWDAAAKTCVGCPAGSFLERPSGSAAWDEDGSCKYKCVSASGQMHFRYPPAEGPIQECLLCPDLAVRMQWSDSSNGNARWPSHAQTCDRNSWVCNVGFVKEAGRCCDETLRPIDHDRITRDGRGGWAADKCEWRCSSGYFPSVPVRGAEWGESCLECKIYLKNSGVPSCYDENPPSSCEGKRVEKSPLECVAQVEAGFTLRGLARDGFTPSVELVFRQGVADANSNIDTKDVVVKSVAGEGGSRRQALSRRAVLLVVVEIRGIEPFWAASIESSVRRSGASVLNNRLSSSGIAATADPVVEVQMSAGSSTWDCEPPLTKNGYTGQCCRKGLGASADGSRYVWGSNGCDWTCRQGFVQEQPSSECLTCSEYNELKRRFKPAHAKWRDDSADCSEWVCEPGYVRSASGFSCIALSKLQAACGAFARCAQCVQDGDCVWCNGKCQAGVLRENGNSCPYTADGAMGPCNCEASRCTDECSHNKCFDCVKDDYCGWCSASNVCMLGSYFRPNVGECASSAWIFNSDGRCGSDDKLWVIGLICATGSVLLVAILGGYVVTRVRMLQRREQDRAAGRLPEQRQLREQTQRFVSTFPTFKYNGKRLPMQQTSPPAGPDEGSAPEASQEEGDEPLCSICLVWLSAGCACCWHEKCVRLVVASGRDV